MIKPLEVKYTPKDFSTDQDVRWCPGCGDYAVLAAVRKALPELQTRREDTVFVSGIGCAARFPYYMNTYGMHSIHGRAPAFATGIKLANPDLQVWVVSGDGDLLSIGGNHTIHAMRRNLDINIVLLNNRIYGLTKGQYSPTSEFGKRTKSTPMGSVDYPIHPLNTAVAAGATFIARCVDKEVNLLTEIMQRAAEHKGLSFIEVLQDCNVFNHQAWAYASEKGQKEDSTCNSSTESHWFSGRIGTRAFAPTTAGLKSSLSRAVKSRTTCWSTTRPTEPWPIRSPSWNVLTFRNRSAFFTATRTANPMNNSCGRRWTMPVNAQENRT